MCFPDIVCPVLTLRFKTNVALCGKHIRVSTKIQCLLISVSMCVCDCECVCMCVCLVSMIILIKLNRPHIEGMVYPVYTGYKERDKEGVRQSIKHLHITSLIVSQGTFLFYFIVWHLFLKAWQFFQLFP